MQLQPDSNRKHDLIHLLHDFPGLPNLETCKQQHGDDVRERALKEYRSIAEKPGGIQELEKLRTGLNEQKAVYRYFWEVTAGVVAECSREDAPERLQAAKDGAMKMHEQVVWPVAILKERLDVLELFISQEWGMGLPVDLDAIDRHGARPLADGQLNEGEQDKLYEKHPAVQKYLRAARDLKGKNYNGIDEYFQAIARRVLKSNGDHPGKCAVYDIFSNVGLYYSGNDFQAMRERIEKEAERMLPAELVE